ncbi:MAG: hypothetical protein KTR32_16645 [Granulosicoccus sp.]|nr:hypothetical protein [Granulosicoccus sp.]
MTALRLKSCDVPLKRNKNTGICEHGKFFRPKDKNCGQLNQRACRPTATRLKACDFGLRKNRDTGLCELGKVISARQHGCGSLNQVPCQITGTRLKACDFGYKRNEDHTKCIHGGLTLRPVSPHCGAQEQRACKKTEALFSCKTKDLRRDPQTGLCKLKANKKELKRRAKKILQEETGGLIKVMFAMQKCLKGDPMALINPDFQKFADKADLVKRAIKDKDVNIAIALMMSGCAEPLLEAAEHGNYETVTIGITGGGGVIVGGFIDQGFAFHVSSLRDFVNDPVNHAFPTPTYYQTKSVSVGVQAGASAGISMGLYKDAARVADLRGADTQGYTFEAIGAVGASVGVWFKYGAEYDGISAAAVVGVEGGAGAYNRLNTAIVSLDKPETNTINCGGPNQRACKLWENPMICEQGLEHNFEKSLCEAPASQTQQVQFVQTSTGNGLDCGANGQRVCRVQEQIPGCNPGLVINFQAKVCARP